MTFGSHCDASNYYLNFSPAPPILLGAYLPILFCELFSQKKTLGTIMCSLNTESDYVA